ncbi:hypothetical protein K4K54_005668 [Colletotrichum sp. SAR 10_86]|nr:hypothetical protein K4K52_003339 [Colletotrichum sp. SAR 10_76]KAI8235651.1 hypothetical protein K4K54_005668 [Colletotrichum sp. SAR 10_86]KAJ3962468.1 hypothetical protein N0V92_000845 [Colletotrichum tropicale]KAJ5006930.1 hypothetical protein K4K48_001799 [Colletotrichum sp. SAR 10_66]
MSDENQLFWKAYASAVKNIMNSSPVGENVRVYIAAANTAGISGGKDIPPECTNWGIYQYADFLLDPTNPNWVASKGSRYSEALNMTLQTLTPGKGGDTSPDAWDRLNKAKERLAIYKKELDDAKKEAMQDFKDDDNPDKPKSFAQWAPLNANAYLVAVNNWEGAANEVQMRTNAIGGAGSALLANAMKQVANGTNTLTQLNGYNMKASIQSVTYDASGKPIIPDPLETQYVPQYSIQGYAALLDGWVANTNQQPSEFTIDLSKGEQSSYKDLGFTEAQGSASFSRFPVFELYGSGGGRVEHSNFDMSSNAKDVKVKLKVQHYKTIPFAPGSWNVDVNGLIAKLEAKPPAMFQKVRPTQMLVASGVSMEISFSGNAKTAFDKDYKKTVQGGGGMSIFGFRIGASGSSSEENSSHGNTWDSSSGTLTINSENSRASANVLAVMGEIVSA